ncbi:hypothetical protein CLAFUW4_13178 [Fulvia fulva]|uniref:Uncharacterized protein n=1 Tax=Passalora fulva TaxID=5499 RepID=A0A9Q8UV86_PASFU|nr:uncharacterized protein CLAFUR5_13035 [Fulvia fulva]KAK4612121.1 hypothetical protein CLAFUR4_13183 [Fulvia fulva]KAK4612966.1 hypothetical protein CLAFUR0_13187 [Fulvia fulva]UJO23607.1 hypothetical protein CLAFUR5_13035 [Fulvia fulva]WPV21344.1 hypothetical protein CLAFUW4_13178 [Fulvia fulva]WPV35870.1 hypothetical protein CLAFUW7_13186 [Fulvia fulva]
MSNAPTLINLPPPPSDPVTPSEVPSRSGTPNSTTTSMSELSTVAIKDGHRGHLPHHSSHHHPGSSRESSGLSHQLDAERADRISRLAGLERVTTARNPQTPTSYAPGSSGITPGAAAPPQHPAATTYFDATGNPAMGRERSTVGSASATGSVGARTTWAGSEAGDRADYDKMSESQDMDMDTSSVGGMSEEGTGSLVAFGEGARTPARQSTISSPGGKAATPRDARMIDGMTYDQHVLDTTSGQVPGRGQEEAERIMRDNMDTTSADRMRRGQGPRDLGSFGFEK